VDWRDWGCWGTTKKLELRYAAAAAGDELLSLLFL
jgi:hypothetical protein